MPQVLINCFTMHWEERFPIFFSGYIQKQPDMEGRFPGRGEGGFPKKYL